MSGLFLHKYKESIEGIELHYLSKISSKKIDQINEHVSDRISDVNILSKNPFVIDAASRLETILETKKVDSGDYLRVDADLRSRLIKYLELGYYDIFLISTDGDIIFSILHEDDVFTNIINGPYKDSGLSKVARDALSVFETGISIFEYYPPSNETAAFVAAPIINDDILLGVLAVQIDSDRVFNVINDNVGLGFTGETNVAHLEDNIIYFNRATKESFEDSNREIKVENGSDLAVPMQLALNGEMGRGIETDFSGAMVIATWNYLPVFNWGIVVKKNAAEAFAPVAQMKKYIYLALISILCVIFVLAYYGYRAIVVPVENLTRAALEIAGGDFNRRVISGSTDEVGRLAEAFNTMAVEIQMRQQELTEKIDEANKANAAKSRFLSRMSHELRTPMNAILGFGQLLELDAEDLTEAQNDYVRETLVAGHHLLDLINEVLDLTSIESGSFKLDMQAVGPDALMLECISLVRALADDRQVEIINHVVGDIPRVYADRSRLKQVMVNLLTNAVKYNGVKGCVTLDCEIIENHRLRVNVTDSGDGLSKEQIERLFTPFERLGQGEDIEGTGMGLVITKYLVELMGGTVGVYSTVGEGSTFWAEFVLASES
jgi:signal transduction histidine kinase